MGETISLNGTLSIAFGAAGVVSGAAAAALGVPAAAGGAAAAALVEGPFSSLRRNPSFSISKTERSCFFIRSMMALISLRSLGSKRCSFGLRLSVYVKQL